MTALSKYKTPDNFLMTYSPSNAGAMVMKNGRQGMIDADTPSLTIIKYAFGEKVVTTFLNGFLIDSAKFYGMISEKTNPETLYGISDAIMVEYPYLKVSELVLFFQLMKSGHFRDSNDNDRGKMYGSFNGEVVMDCLYKFKQERARHIEQKEAERKKLDYDKMISDAVPPPPGVFDKINKAISSIGHPELKHKRTLSDMQYIDKNHITRFDKPSDDDIALRNKHNQEFLEMLENQKRMCKIINDNNQ